MGAGHDGADDPHPRHPGDVGHDVVQLHVHLHQRLLHMLDVRRGIVYQAFSMAQVGAELNDPVARTETAPKQAMLVELLQPLRDVHVGLAARDVLDVAGVHQEHLEPCASSTSKTGIQYTPVDSMATVVIPTPSANRPTDAGRC